MSHVKSSFTVSPLQCRSLRCLPRKTATRFVPTRRWWPSAAVISSPHSFTASPPVLHWQKPWWRTQQAAKHRWGQLTQQSLVGICLGCVCWPAAKLAKITKIKAKITILRVGKPPRSCVQDLVSNIIIPGFFTLSCSPKSLLPSSGVKFDQRPGCPPRPPLLCAFLLWSPEVCSGLYHHRQSSRGAEEV